jgi:hypothetical protein
MIAAWKPVAFDIIVWSTGGNWVNGYHLGNVWVTNRLTHVGHWKEYRGVWNVDRPRCEFVIWNLVGGNLSIHCCCEWCCLEVMAGCHASEAMSLLWNEVPVTSFCGGTVLDPCRRNVEWSMLTASWCEVDAPEVGTPVGVDGTGCHRLVVDILAAWMPLWWAMNALLPLLMLEPCCYKVDSDDWLVSSRVVNGMWHCSLKWCCCLLALCCPRLWTVCRLMTLLSPWLLCEVLPMLWSAGVNETGTCCHVVEDDYSLHLVAHNWLLDVGPCVHVAVACNL